MQQVASANNPNAQSAQPIQVIWQDHSFATTALTTFKKLSGKFSRFGEQCTLLKNREATATDQQQATQEASPEVDNIILGLKSGDINELKNALWNKTITLEQALGIIDGALRSNIKPETKTALLNTLLETAQSNKDTKNQITEFFSYILTDKTSNFPNEIKQQAITALFQNGNDDVSETDNDASETDNDVSETDNDVSEMRSAIFGQYDNNHKMPEPLLNALKDALLVKRKDNNHDNDENGIELTEYKTNENFLEELKDCKPWAIQVYAHAIENNSNILQNFKINVRSQEHCDNYHLQTLLYGLRNGHEWAKNLIETDDKLASQVADTIKDNLESNTKSTRNEAISLLKNIINSSNKIPTAILNLLINAANQIEMSAAADSQTTINQLPNWLSDVMRGIKPDAFKKIAEQIVVYDENEWENITGTNGDVTDRLDTIAILALATLPKDDSKINESCMPFTALNGLLSISNEKNEINGTNIVASIGKALVDADCDNPTWTNTRTTTFLKSLNAIDSTKIEAGQEKSPSEMAKDALLSCRLQLENNSYKFDVAIQYVADDESEQKQEKDKKESSAQNPTPITSFFVDCLSPAAYNELDLGSIMADIHSFQNYTGEPLYQFKPQTYERIKDAMIMNHARKAYAFKKYQEYKEELEASSNDDGIELDNNDIDNNDIDNNDIDNNDIDNNNIDNNNIDNNNIDNNDIDNNDIDNNDIDNLDDQTISTHKREVEKKMGNDFNTWYNENKENIADGFNEWYSKNQEKITEHLNDSTSDDNGTIDLEGITPDRFSFQKQLQCLGRIDKSRYHTLSDEHIQEVTNNILKLAGDSQLQAELMNNNPFKSNYILEKSCSQLLNYFEHGENGQTKAHAKTALKTILRHYCCNNKRFANAKKELDNNNISAATNEFIAALRSHNDSIKDINEKMEAIQYEEIEVRGHEGLTEANPLHDPDDPAAKLFTKHRELKGVSGHSRNCLFYSICGQKPGEDNDKYNSYELRQKYVEIQTAKAQQVGKTADVNQLNNEQADISCLPQMATHLERPIVVLTEKSQTGQGENDIQIFLPGNGQNGHAIIIPLNSLGEKIKDVITEGNNPSQYNDILNAVKTALGKDDNELNKLTVKDALEILLGDSNTIALHFQGDTNGGHYQSFVPKGQDDADNNSN